MSLVPVGRPVNPMKPETLVVILLDQSGSMAGKRSDVEGGITYLLEAHRRLNDPCRFGLVRFNEAVEPLSIAPIRAYEGLKAFRTVGGTALFDAFVATVQAVDVVKRVGERVVLVVATDGEENSSRNYTAADVAKVVAAHEASGEWTFAYAGPSPHKWARASGGGVGNTVHQVNIRKALMEVSASLTAFRQGKAKQTKQFFMLTPGSN